VRPQNPPHFRADLLPGRIFHLQQPAREAEPYLKQAVNSEPRNFEAHAFLADAYDQLGNTTGAESERARAQILKNASQ
jgi:predicted Zn-dependent protease